MQSPRALAINCNSVSIQNQELCNQIIASNITLYEQELLISNLDYNSTYFPDHNYIFLRNTALSFGVPPIGINFYQSTYIQNAWFSIMALMPSVFYNNTLYCSQNTQILSASNYNLIIPPTYQSGSYPSTSNGDCRRTYNLLSNNSQTNVFVNSIYQASGSLTDLTIYNRSSIFAQNTINVSVQIDHHNWDTYCCKYDDGECTKYCHQCVFSWTQIDKDSLTINDSLNVTYYEANLYGSVISKDKYLDTQELEINFSNSIEVDFNGSSYKSYEYLYELNYSKAPYYLATLTAKKQITQRINNLVKEGSRLFVSNQTSCTIHAFDFFNNLYANCDLSFEPFVYSISSDKFYYYHGKEIHVFVEPSNFSVNLTYGNSSEYGSNVTFIAQKNENKITAIYDNKKKDIFILVYEPSKIILLWRLLILGLAIYLVYLFAKKKARSLS